jgi:oxygen-independent coproporphyrinogen-3 oxidase
MARLYSTPNENNMGCQEDWALSSRLSEVKKLLSIDSPFYELVYTYPRLAQLPPIVADEFASRLRTRTKDEDIGLYVHIPFCTTKCRYCYFPTLSDPEASTVNEYISCLEGEIFQLSEVLGHPSARTVYIGGGTPTYLSADMAKELMRSLDSAFSLKQSEEITVETNPTISSMKSLEAFLEFGVSRISVGVQSLSDSVLEDMRRPHNKKDVCEFVGCLAGLGFRNTNVDLIAGYPGQTLQDLRSTVLDLFGMGIGSITCYDLWVSNDSPLLKRCSVDALDPIRIIKDRWFTHQILRDCGYKQHNAYWYLLDGSFVARDYERRWRNRNLAVVGLGSYGILDRVVYQNAHRLTDYVDRVKRSQLPVLRGKTLDETSWLKRKLALGIKLSAGISADDAALSVVEKAKINSLLDHELLRWRGGRLQLTDFGSILADRIIAYIIPELNIGIDRGRAIPNAFSQSDDCAPNSAATAVLDGNPDRSLDHIT